MKTPLALRTPGALERRVVRDARGRFAVPRRRRSDDLARLLCHAVESMGILERLVSEIPDERPTSFEIGVCVTLPDAARAIGLTPELFNPKSNRRHFSADQLAYVEGLVYDLPQAFARALLRDGPGQL